MDHMLIHLLIYVLELVLILIIMAIQRQINVYCIALQITINQVVFVSQHVLEQILLIMWLGNVEQCAQLDIGDLISFA